MMCAVLDIIIKKKNQNYTYNFLMIYLYDFLVLVSIFIRVDHYWNRPRTEIIFVIFFSLSLVISIYTPGLSATYISALKKIKIAQKSTFHMNLCQKKIITFFFLIICMIGVYTLYLVL